MKKKNQDERKEQIRVAAYELLEKKGYKATSMLAIAKQAKASNETLYSWYGSKQNLFSTLIEENAKEVTTAINDALNLELNIEKSITQIGILLITLVTSTRAISLNRAAAAEASETKTLGKILAKKGRNSVFPLIEKLFLDAKSKGEVKFKNSDEVVRVYIGLLLGDIQIRRVIGAIEPLSVKEIESQSNRATTLLFALLSGNHL